MAEQEKNTPAEKKAEKPAKAKKPSLFARIGKWFRELKGECKKIIWVLDAVFQFGVSALIR